MAALPRRPAHCWFLSLLVILYWFGTLPVAVVGDEDASSSSSSLKLTTPTKSSQISSQIRPSESNNINARHRNNNPTNLAPKTSFTLSEKFASLPRGGAVDDDFAERLRQEEEQLVAATKEEEEDKTSSSSTTTTTTSSRHATVWAMLGSAASLLLVSAIMSPSTVWSEGVTMFHSLLSLYWVRQLSRPSSLADLLVVFHVITRPGTLEAFRDHVVPTIYSVFKTLLLTEAWSYFWKVAWKFLAETVPQSEKTETESPKWLPEWLQPVWLKSSAFVDKLLEKGTRRIIQKVLKKNIQEAFATLASKGAKVVEEEWASKLKQQQ